MAATLDTIEFQLHLLFQHETVNGFLRDYYRLVYEELTRDESREAALCDLFSEFLDLEIHHHYWIGFIAETLSAREKALDAYRRAAKADSGFAPVCAEKEQMLSDGGLELRESTHASHALSVFEHNVAQIIGNGG